MAPSRTWNAIAGLGVLALILGAAAACRNAPIDEKLRPASAIGPQQPSATAQGEACAVAPPAEAGRPARPLRRCFAELPVWIDSPVADLLDRAGAYLEAGDVEGVLACAEEASRQAPRSVEAHHDRALALIRLGRVEEARDAVGLALAIAPEDAETLELAAELYINQLAPSAERTAIGLEYARRGQRRSPARERLRRARLALLEGQALIDLGRSVEALRPLGQAVKLSPHDTAARYEQGVALFELCRFDEARAALQKVLGKDPKHAHALYHLSLIEERDGRDAESQRLFREASALDGRSFPPVPEVSPAEFGRRVQAALARLPDDVRADVAGIPVEAAELPSLEDLTAERPPLSPTILGLFRGLPLGRDATPDESVPAARGAQGRQARATAGAAAGENGAATCAVPPRAIVLYRRNILRSIHGLHELDGAIERTLLHEVGHLRGEDDGSLRDRGLE
jgi:Flp pilus assembly protein TadD/predicted Zn-dependent protease with MMP-like domain